MHKKYFIIISILAAIILGLSAWLLVMKSTQYQNAKSLDDQSLSKTSPTNGKTNLSGELDSKPISGEYNYQLVIDPVRVTYADLSNQEKNISIELGFNPDLQVVPAIPLLAESFPQFAGGSFFYHGSVLSLSSGLENELGDVRGWSVMSAVTARSNADEINSTYEKAPSEPVTLTGLLNPEQTTFIALDYAGMGDDLLAEKKSNITQYKYANMFHFSSDGSNNWETSFLKLIGTTGQTGGGGDLTILSDTNKRYVLVYFAAPFSSVQKEAESVDTISGMPIYLAKDQSKTYKNADGKRYQKFFLKAENGFTYILYK